MAITFGKHSLKENIFSNPRKLNNIPTDLLLAKIAKNNPKFPENG